MLGDRENQALLREAVSLLAYGCPDCGHRLHEPGCEAGALPYGADDHVDCGCQWSLSTFLSRPEIEALLKEENEE